MLVEGDVNRTGAMGGERSSDTPWCFSEGLPRRPSERVSAHRAPVPGPSPCCTRRSTIRFISCRKTALAQAALHLGLTALSTWSAVPHSCQLAQAERRPPLSIRSAAAPLSSTYPQRERRRHVKCGSARQGATGMVEGEGTRGPQRIALSIPAIPAITPPFPHSTLSTLSMFSVVNPSPSAAGLMRGA